MGKVVKHRIYRKKRLLEALKKAGLPYTMPNFIEKYERKVCRVADCTLFGKPYLVSPRGEPNRVGDASRLYTARQIDEIIKTAKTGWFEKHWHWPKN